MPFDKKRNILNSVISFGAVDDFAPNPVLPLPYEEAISQGIGPQVLMKFASPVTP